MSTDRITGCDNVLRNFVVTMWSGAERSGGRPGTMVTSKQRVNTHFPGVSHARCWDKAGRKVKCVTKFLTKLQYKHPAAAAHTPQNTQSSVRTSLKIFITFLDRQPVAIEIFERIWSWARASVRDQ